MSTADDADRRTEERPVLDRPLRRPRAAAAPMVPRQLVPFLALILVIAFFSLTGGTRFLSVANASFLLQQSAIIAIPAFGASLVIIAGSIDLSVGSLVALTGMVAAMVAGPYGPVAGIAAALAVGVVVGLANGVGFAVFGVPSFMMTLGMLSIGRGLTVLISASQPVGVGGAFQSLGHMPGLAILFVLCFVAATVLLEFTSIGRRTLAIGGQERVAELSGVPIKRMKILIFTLAGLMAAIGGIALTARVGAATPDAATGFELTAIAAVVLGGTPLTGGIGTMTNTVVGAFILSIILNGMIILGIPSEIQLIVQGLVIVGAVYLSMDRAKIGIMK